jgi:hypothetical protein
MDAKFHHNPRLHGSMGVLVFHGMTNISLPKDNQQACKMLLELEMVM